jgi:beta-lactamase regulating signal transducer with metallopeptidase domain
MPLGTSIFLIALGAILRYAVTASVSGISITTIGLILMIVGITGVMISLFYMVTAGARGGVVRERVLTRDPYEEPPV